MQSIFYTITYYTSTLIKALLRALHLFSTAYWFFNALQQVIITAA